jgi:hypothetical protein
VDQLACPESLLLERQQQRHGCILTLIMLKIFLEAGGDGCCAKSFRYKIRKWLSRLKKPCW